MMRLNRGRMPPVVGDDKWHFPQGAVTLYAGTHEQLVTQLFEYRLRNNLPPGDIERDIDAYYCGKWPSFCYDEGGSGGASPPREPMLNVISRWASTMIHNMPRGGYPLVSAMESASRAAICSNCPKQTDWRGGCGGCSATTLQLLQQIKNQQRTTRDGNLNACSIGRWENGVAVHLSAEVLPISEEQRAAMPEACWRKKLS